MAPAPRVRGAAMAACLFTAAAWAQGTAPTKLTLPSGITAQPLAAPLAAPTPGPPAASQTDEAPPSAAQPPQIVYPGGKPPSMALPRVASPETVQPNAARPPNVARPGALPSDAAQSQGAPQGAAPPNPAQSGPTPPGASPSGATPPGAPPTAAPPATQSATASPPATASQYAPAPPVPEIWQPQGTAVLQLLDKVDAQSATLTIKAGDSAQYGPLTIAVRACDVSTPNEKPDATAFLDITDSHPDLPGFHGWMLRSAPSVSMLQHPIFDVRVLGCRP